MEPSDDPIDPDLQALEEMDENLVYVDGQGWMEPDDPAIEGLQALTRAELEQADAEYEARRRAENG